MKKPKVKKNDSLLNWFDAIKLGYGVLIVPSSDGRCNVFYQPKGGLK